MPITSIKRDFIGDPNIVRIECTDSLATITTAGYIDTQKAAIDAINHGTFEWVEGDLVAINYSNGEGFFTRNASTNAFVAETVPGALSETLASAQIFVGNSSNIATGVTASGDLTNNNTGVFTIANNAVTSAKIAANIRKYATVSISAAAFNGMYATPIQLVAAGGANTLLVLDQLQLVMTYNSAAYAAGGTAAVQYDSTANGAGVIASTTLANTAFQAAASSTFTMNPGVVVLPFATTVNKGLYLSNISGAFTTGNSAMVAHVWWRQIATA